MQRLGHVILRAARRQNRMPDHTGRLFILLRRIPHVSVQYVFKKCVVLHARVCLLLAEDLLRRPKLRLPHRFAGRGRGEKRRAVELERRELFIQRYFRIQQRVFDVK